MLRGGRCRLGSILLVVGSPQGPASDVAKSLSRNSGFAVALRCFGWLQGDRSGGAPGPSYGQAPPGESGPVFVATDRGAGSKAVTGRRRSKDRSRWQGADAVLPSIGHDVAPCRELRDSTVLAVQIGLLGSLSNRARVARAEGDRPEADWRAVSAERRGHSDGRRCPVLAGQGIAGTCWRSAIGLDAKPTERCRVERRAQKRPEG